MLPFPTVPNDAYTRQRTRGGLFVASKMTGEICRVTQPKYLICLLTVSSFEHRVNRGRSCVTTRIAHHPFNNQSGFINNTSLARWYNGLIFVDFRSYDVSTNVTVMLFFQDYSLRNACLPITACHCVRSELRSLSSPMHLLSPVNSNTIQACLRQAKGVMSML